MPYSYRKIRGKDLYKVFNKETGKIHAEGTTLDKAKAQIRLLNQVQDAGGNYVTPEPMTPQKRGRPRKQNITMVITEKKRGRGRPKKGDGFFDDLKSFGNTIKEGVTNAVESVKQGVVETAEKAKEGIVGAADTVKEAVVGTAEKAKEGIVNVAKKVKDTAIALVEGRKDYPPKVRRIVQEYGDSVITGITMHRTPLGKPLMTALQAASGNTFTQKLRNTPYDKLFHLFICIDFNGKSITLEKNEVINSERNCSIPKDTESEVVSNMKMGVTLNEALQKTKERMGGKFFTYSAKDNNCQDFIVAFLQSNGFGTPENISWVKQETKSLFEGDNNRLRKIANTLTDIGSRVDILKQGLGVKKRGRPKKGGMVTPTGTPINTPPQSPQQTLPNMGELRSIVQTAPTAAKIARFQAITAGNLNGYLEQLSRYYDELPQTSRAAQGYNRHINRYREPFIVGSGKRGGAVFRPMPPPIPMTNPAIDRLYERRQILGASIDSLIDMMSELEESILFFGSMRNITRVDFRGRMLTIPQLIQELRDAKELYRDYKRQTRDIDTQLDRYERREQEGSGVQQSRRVVPEEESKISEEEDNRIDELIAERRRIANRAANILGEIEQLDEIDDDDDEELVDILTEQLVNLNQRFQQITAELGMLGYRTPDGRLVGRGSGSSRVAPNPTIEEIRSLKRELEKIMMQFKTLENIDTALTGVNSPITRSNPSMETLSKRARIIVRRLKELGQTPSSIGLDLNILKRSGIDLSGFFKEGGMLPAGATPLMTAGMDMMTLSNTLSLLQAPMNTINANQLRAFIESKVGRNYALFGRKFKEMLMRRFPERDALKTMRLYHQFIRLALDEITPTNTLMDTDSEEYFSNSSLDSNSSMEGDGIFGRGQGQSRRKILPAENMRKIAPEPQEREYQVRIPPSMKEKQESRLMAMEDQPVEEKDDTEREYQVRISPAMKQRRETRLMGTEDPKGKKRDADLMELRKELEKKLGAKGRISGVGIKSKPNVKMENSWITYVKAYAKKNNMKYNEALKDPRLKAGYKSMKGEGILEDITAGLSKVGEPFKAVAGVNPFTAGYDLGYNVIGPALLGKGRGRRASFAVGSGMPTNKEAVIANTYEQKYLGMNTRGL